MTKDEAIAQGLIAEFRVLQKGRMIPFAYIQEVEVIEAPPPAPGRLPTPPTIQGTLQADPSFVRDPFELMGTTAEFEIVSLDGTEGTGLFSGFFVRLSPLDGNSFNFVMQRNS